LVEKPHNCQKLQFQIRELQLRSIQLKLIKQQLPSLSDHCSATFIYFCVIFSGHRRKWSETEINALIRAFSGYRRPPNFQECRNVQDMSQLTSALTSPDQITCLGTCWIIACQYQCNCVA